MGVELQEGRGQTLLQGLLRQDKGKWFQTIRGQIYMGYKEDFF